jgi:predicted NBD/HSP70 family sugar kinase
MSTKAKNPLFVVTNNGQDVEQAEGLLDALVKRLGLEPVMEVLDEILEQLIAASSSYTMIQVLEEWVDQLVRILEKIIRMIDPLLAFEIFKR